MNKSLRRLESQLMEMEQKIPFWRSIDPEVSKVPVGWHLEHNIKVIRSVLKGLEISEPALYRKKFNWKKELVFLTGRIPRGKARAPKITRPKENISEDDLFTQLRAVRTELKDFGKLSENAFFEHPFFGHVHRDDTPRFLVIHTEHHLKIIRDILKSSYRE